MRCQRCLSGKEARHRVKSDSINVLVCDSCAEQARKLGLMEASHRELGNEALVLVAVTFRESPDEVKAYLHKHQLSVTALVDRDGEFFSRYEAWSLPTTYVIGKDGELVGKAVGYSDWNSEQAMAFFRQLLGNKT